MSNSNSITRIMTAILLASTTIMAILFVGTPDNMINIAYTVEDDSGTSIVDLIPAQDFKETQGCDKLDAEAIWCV